MKPSWFSDTIPVDPLIAPMVVFFRDNGIITINSCQGGKGHSHGKPTISFKARTLDEIDHVALLLKRNDLYTSLEIGLMTGFYGSSFGSRDVPRYGQAHWLWAEEDGETNVFKSEIYDRVVRLVDMAVVGSLIKDYHK